MHLVNLAQTAAEQGATLLNYAPVVAITKGGDGFVDGVVMQDLESGRERAVHARVVINAAGPFSDGVRRLAEPDAPPLIAPSQGVHLVFDHSFLPGTSAIMVPHTRDGRVMFAIPWHGHTLVGTTDTPIPEATLEPRPLDDPNAAIRHEHRRGLRAYRVFCSWVNRTTRARSTRSTCTSRRTAGIS